jgi:hypothetical protein
MTDPSNAFQASLCWAKAVSGGDGNLSHTHGSVSVIHGPMDLVVAEAGLRPAL